MKHRIIFLLISLSILLTACTQRATTLRIAINPWPGYEFLHLAEKLGYFADENIQVELVEFLSLADSSRAFERGQVDAWCTTVVELVLSRHHSTRQAAAIWVTNISRGADVLLAKEPIRSPADLRGKRIGIEPATVDVVLLNSALNQAGLSLEDIKVVHLSHANMKAEIEDNNVDAVTVYPPESTEIELLKGINRVFDSNQMPEIIIDMIAVDKKSFNENNRKWHAVIHAFKRAQQYAIDHPDEANAIMASHMGISKAEFEKLVKGIHIIYGHEQAEYMQKKGKLSAALSSVRKALISSGIELADIDIDSLYINLSIQKHTEKK